MDIALDQLDVATIEHPVRVFDLACGNMRFENFAAGGTLAAKGVDGASPSADASCPFEFYGVDSCQDLAIDARGHALRIPNLHFQELDVLDALMKLNPAETPDVLFDAPLADISVCFALCTTCRRASTAYACSTLGASDAPGWHHRHQLLGVYERRAHGAQGRSRRGPCRAHPARLRVTIPRSLKPATTSSAGNDRHAYRYCHHF